jgi:CRP-like cAMP-binding protein
MDSQITAALVALAIVIIGSLGTLVKMLVDNISAELSVNTQITKQARDASNGQLSGMIEQLAAERNRVQGLLAVVHDREDRVAYLVSRVPTATALLQEFAARRVHPVTDADVIIAENHALGDRS